MKVKPKEVLVSLPTVIILPTEDEAAQTAAAFNTFLHGKVKLKYEILGVLNGHVVIFYLQRNNEFQQLRDEFMEIINEAEQNWINSPPEPIYDPEHWDP
jgi:hypothetical protein